MKMRSLLYLFMLVSFAACSGGNGGGESAGAGAAVLKFEEITFDFGDIMEGEVVTHTYKFTNTGSAPLRITEVKPGCGCTTPSYTKTDVMPNETGEVTLSFNSDKRPGVASKSTSVKSNGGEVQLSFRCNVIAKEGGETNTGGSTGPVKDNSGTNLTNPSTTTSNDKGFKLKKNVN